MGGRGAHGLAGPGHGCRQQRPGQSLPRSLTPFPNLPRARPGPAGAGTRLRDGQRCPNPVPPPPPRRHHRKTAERGYRRSNPTRSWAESRRYRPPPPCPGPPLPSSRGFGVEPAPPGGPSAPPPPGRPRRSRPPRHQRRRPGGDPPPRSASGRRGGAAVLPGPDPGPAGRKRSWSRRARGPRTSHHHPPPPARARKGRAARAPPPGPWAPRRERSPCERRFTARTSWGCSEMFLRIAGTGRFWAVGPKHACCGRPVFLECAY